MPVQDQYTRSPVGHCLRRRCKKLKSLYEDPYIPAADAAPPPCKIRDIGHHATGHARLTEKMRAERASELADAGTSCRWLLAT